MSDPIYLKARCGVRYWEDATVNDVEDVDGSLIPCRDGASWCPTIEIATGRIVDWPAGTVASVHYKVCDDGDYWLTDANGETVSSRRDDYVPDAMCPAEPGYGDYVIMEIGPDGVIAKWNPRAALEVPRV